MISEKSIDTTPRLVTWGHNMGPLISVVLLSHIDIYTQYSTKLQTKSVWVRTDFNDRFSVSIVSQPTSEELHFPFIRAAKTNEVIGLKYLNEN